jgi:hypothetical protein
MSKYRLPEHANIAVAAAFSPALTASAALSEGRLNRHVKNFRRMRANLGQPSNRGGELTTIHSRMNSEDRDLSPEDARRNAIENELRSYLNEPCQDESTELTNTGILDYWKVRAFAGFTFFSPLTSQ